MAPTSLWSPARIAAGALCALPCFLSGTAAQAAGDYYVHELPGAPEGDLIKMHAGHVEVNPEQNGNLFFWHFENQHIANRQRTVIWLNGGPGCSSEDGAMMEIGPYRMKDADTLEYNNGSWHEFANLLFVDNPVGTGYSYVDTNHYVQELDQMANQFITFLEKWFELFPEYEHDDLYLAGESFAGQHIPYIAKAILDHNKDPRSTRWNLKGLLIGNGWIAPKEQYEAYLSYSYDKGLIKKGSDDAASLETLLRSCQKELAASSSNQVSNSVCEQVLMEMLRMTQKKVSKTESTCVNMYDVRLTDTFPSCGMNWPPDLKYVTPYLRKVEVTNALHINTNKNTGWTECNGAVGQAFSGRNSRPAIDYLPEILEEVNVLLFSGSEDLICNHLGTESFISNMEWNGGKGFETTPGNWAPRRDWTVEGEDAGFWQEARNLTYVLFYNSSHMVPFDYPRRTRDMLDRFMGVDISSIGGTPTDSELDGEKLPDTTVGGATNQTTGSQASKDKEVSDAKWAAYQKSGEVVLAVVAVAAAAWGFYVWRARRRTRGYTGLPLVSERGGGRGVGLDGFRSKGRSNGGDIEAGDFDESELDDLHVTSPTDLEGSGGGRGGGDGHYSVGDDSDDDDVVTNEKGKAVGTSRGQSSRGA
ncbi:Alpha/Beta hydrolase protein [Xylariaceae sp. FL0804]|nr:Alpha/Beta hydrolase protein [Xylariaceae sp. FL0804]